MAPCRLTDLRSSCEPLGIPPPSPRWLRLRHREPNAPQRSGGGGWALGLGAGAARDRRSECTQLRYFETLNIAGSRVNDLGERETNRRQHHYQYPSLSSCSHHSLPPFRPHASSFPTCLTCSSPNLSLFSFWFRHRPISLHKRRRSQTAIQGKGETPTIFFEPMFGAGFFLRDEGVRAGLTQRGWEVPPRRVTDLKKKLGGGLLLGSQSVDSGCCALPLPNGGCILLFGRPDPFIWDHNVHNEWSCSQLKGRDMNQIPHKIWGFFP